MGNRSLQKSGSPAIPRENQTKTSKEVQQSIAFNIGVQSVIPVANIIKWCQSRCNLSNRHKETAEIRNATLGTKTNRINPPTPNCKEKENKPGQKASAVKAFHIGVQSVIPVLKHHRLSTGAIREWVGRLHFSSWDLGET